MKKIGIIFLLFLTIYSCATKKDILYLQNAEKFDGTSVVTESSLIQPNDILQINITAFPNEPAIPYNRVIVNSGNANRENLVDGYLVSNDGTIVLPILGTIDTNNQTVLELQEQIRNQLISMDHLKNPIVEVRVLNNKFSILGEVNGPGTYRFYENNFTIFQALGIAGDLSINGKRDNILFIREINGTREVTHIDLTSADIFNSPYYFIKPNDQIYVSPNGPKIKSAGYIGNLGSLLSVFSILLSTTLILTR